MRQCRGRIVGKVEVGRLNNNYPHPVSLVTFSGERNGFAEIR